MTNVDMISLLSTNGGNMFYGANAFTHGKWAGKQGGIV